MASQYYIHRVSCKAHNKKTLALCVALTRFNFSLITFWDGFTLDDMFSRLQGIVKDINTKGKSREIEVRKSEYNDTVTFSFCEVPNNGETVASFCLHPVINYIDN